MRLAFSDQRESIMHFFDNVNIEEAQNFANQVLNCPGLVYFTGTGKSGIVARNISQLLVSIGIRSMFLSPVDALHGDVGVLRPGDTLVLLSKSGQSSELLDLLPAVR